MPDRCAVVVRHSRPDETQCCDYCCLDRKRQRDRVADGDRGFAEYVHHDFLLSFRTRSISDRSSSKSSSLHAPSRTRAVIISLSDPPKNVCKYCCSAACLASAGDIVAEYRYGRSVYVWFTS